MLINVKAKVEGVDKFGFHFTLDGIPRTTEYGGELADGSHNLTFSNPDTVGAVTYDFLRWEDEPDNTDPSRNFNTPNVQGGLYVAIYEVHSDVERGTISGTVTDKADNAPLFNVRITIGTSSVYTDTYGVYSIGNINYGNRIVNANLADYDSEAKTVTLDAPTKTVDFQLHKVGTNGGGGFPLWAIVLIVLAAVGAVGTGIFIIKKKKRS